jgi:rSAM/selenodomain-associated transferase 1
MPVSGEDMSDTALVIMARTPRAGEGKTRLAVTLGADATLRLYQAFLTDLARRFAGQAYRLHWAYTPIESHFLLHMQHLVPDLVVGTAFPQAGSEFGSRLHHAFCTLFAGDIQKAILIGSDSPHISQESVLQAERALEWADVVLGPAEDGGYYLLAMRAPHDLFTGIPMSTPHVLRQTVEHASRLGLRVHLLEPFLDVDDWPALCSLAHLLSAHPELAPATAACLMTLPDVTKERL